MRKFIREKEVNGCTITQTKINGKYHVKIVGYDPIYQTTGKIFSLTSDNKEELWKTAKERAKRHNY